MNDEKDGIRKNEDPSQSFNLYTGGKNIGSQAHKISEVFYVFKNRYNFMTNHSYQERESILKELINPSNQRFEDFFES